MKNKEREILKDICKNGSKRFGAKDLETYQKLEAQGLVYYYYEYGRWNAEITSEGIKALSESENTREFVKGVVVIIAVIVVGLLLSSCTSTKEISNSQTTQSHVTNQHSATERKDSIVYRDSISYVERMINDTVYITKEAIRWRFREKLVYDTLQVLQTDSVYVYRDVEKVVEKQPSWWQRMKDGVSWCFILLMALGVLYVVCKMIKRR